MHCGSFFLEEGALCLIRRFIATARILVRTHPTKKSNKKQYNEPPARSKDVTLSSSQGTWRFMGSYKWGYKSLSMGYKY